MSQKVLIRVVGEAGEPLDAQCHLTEGDETCTFQCAAGMPFELPISGPASITVVPKSGGFWVTHAEVNAPRATIICSRIAPTVSSAWWRRCMGAPLSNAQRGAKIKIGIVDTSFAPSPGIEHVRVLGRARALQRLDIEPRIWRHGEMVARIIGQRSDDPMRQGLAPAAELTCYAAETAKEIDCEEQASVFDYDILDLEPSSLADAIVKLVDKHHVHLINISAGCRKPSKPLTEAIEYAWDAGALCVVAAGNSGGAAIDFPASMDKCVAVGAIGCGKLNPANSYVAQERELSLEAKLGARLGGYGDVYRWHQSSIGPGLDAVAPGIGVVVSRHGPQSFDLAGTSFSAPMATGALAVALGTHETYPDMTSDAARADLAREQLFSICRSLSMTKAEFGRGVPEAIMSEP